MTNAAASNPLFHTSGGTLCHTCRHAHTPMSMCTYLNTHHTCHMHNHTQSLRAMPHSSNRPANLSQGAPVCDSVTVCMRECECVRACMCALAMSQSGEEQVGEREIRTEREERADRPGRRDEERKN